MRPPRGERRHPFITAHDVGEYTRVDGKARKRAARQAREREYERHAAPLPGGGLTLKARRWFVHDQKRDASGDAAPKFSGKGHIIWWPDKSQREVVSACGRRYWLMGFSPQGIMPYFRDLLTDREQIAGTVFRWQFQVDDLCPVCALEFQRLVRVGLVGSYDDAHHRPDSEEKRSIQR
jgi:hypothetical protein